MYFHKWYKTLSKQEPPTLPEHVSSPLVISEAVLRAVPLLVVGIKCDELSARTDGCSFNTLGVYFLGFHGCFHRLIIFSIPLLIKSTFLWSVHVTAEDVSLIAAAICNLYSIQLYAIKFVIVLFKQTMVFIFSFISPLQLK
jgi:hypothetical protein